MNKTFASLAFIVALVAVSGIKPVNAAEKGNVAPPEKYDVKCFYHQKIMIDDGPYSIANIPNDRAIHFITLKDPDGRKIMIDEHCILTQILPEDEERERAAIEAKEKQQFPEDGEPRHAIGG